VARSGGNSALDLSPYIKVRWSAPRDDGGSVVLGYFVEMKNANSGASSWSTVYDGSAQPDILEFTFQDRDLITAG
jgi:hypothetical protein